MTDRIERQILLKSSRSRVWRALSDTKEFGDWFGVSFRGKTMAPGVLLQGNITHPGYEHVVFEALIERVEPERLLSWRWHPFAVEPSVDYTAEPMTLVVFELQDAPGGTLLSVVESGFDNIPPARRLTAFRMNTDGWEQQMHNIAKHVATP
jgi:uncharacterized protein YndB with AHSA1/START domain